MAKARVVIPGNIHVLVVDDSAVVRQIIAHILTAEGMAVTTAPDPLIAMDKMRRQLPDVIVLDLEMPRMDGLTFLRKLMTERPTPVVICSGVAQRGTEAALAALQQGAVEVVAKPRVGVKEFLHESAVLLVDAVRAAAEACTTTALKARPAVRPGAQVPKVAVKGCVQSAGRCIAVGASTGGTEALLEILQKLPSDAPGVVIAQHMPEKFTAAFAKRLHEVCAIEVKEAEDGDEVCSGRALIAPGGRHMEVAQKSGGLFVRILDGPLVSRHRPSVDVLFRSVARWAPRSVGMIMTGMGNDGAQGLLEMRQAGAFTLAQDESTCVVFGMPKEAIEAGAVCTIQPLSRLMETALLNFYR